MDTIDIDAVVTDLRETEMGMHAAKLVAGGYPLGYLVRKEWFDRVIQNSSNRLFTSGLFGPTIETSVDLDELSRWFANKRPNGMDFVLYGDLERDVAILEPASWEGNEPDELVLVIDSFYKSVHVIRVIEEQFAWCETPLGMDKLHLRLPHGPIGQMACSMGFHLTRKRDLELGLSYHSCWCGAKQRLKLSR